MLLNLCLRGIKCFLFLGILTTCFLPQAHSLLCYSCNSSKSWDHCDSNGTQAKCLASDTTCVKYDYVMTNTNSPKQTMFSRGCLPQSQCSSSSLPACRELAKTDGNKVTCEVSCCGTDLCNSNVQTISSAWLILMMLFIVLSF